MQDLTRDHLEAEVVSGRVKFGAGFDNPPPPEALPGWIAAIPAIEPVEINASNAPPPWLLPPELRPQSRRRPCSGARACGVLAPPQSHVLTHASGRERHDRPTRRQRAAAADERGDPDPDPAADNQPPAASFAWLEPLTRGMSGSERMAFFYDGTPEWMQAASWTELRIRCEQRREQEWWDR
jgi:hypothetical protein